MNALGIDIGTTGICGVKVDCKTGEMLSVVSRNNDTFIESKLDFEKIQDADKILEKIQEIAAELCDSETVCIGFSNQMHGIVYTDDKINALSPLYIWQDGRGNEKYNDTQTYAQYLNSFSGYGLVTDFYNRENGLVPQNTAHAMTIGDFCALRLCGETKPVMHVTNAASFGLFDVENKKFTVDLPYLPKVTDKYDVVGRYNGVPVTVSVGDNQASFIGSVRENDSVLVNVGTGSQVSVLTQENASHGGVEIRPFDSECNLAAGCALCGGRAFSIVSRFIAKSAELVTGEKNDAIYAQIDKALANKTSTTVKADTRFCGTRADSSIRGFYSNVDEDNFTPEDFLLATLYGMTNELYDLYKQCDKDCENLVCSGNGVRKNPALKRIITEIFGKEIKIPVYKEEAAFGVALTAMAGTGIYESIAQARQLIKYEGE